MRVDTAETLCRIEQDLAEQAGRADEEDAPTRHRELGQALAHVKRALATPVCDECGKEGTPLNPLLGSGFGVVPTCQLCLSYNA